jgi:hypothetical protein
MIFLLREHKFIYRVGLAQLVRFLMVELINSGLISKFDMCVIFIPNYSFSGNRHPIDNETLLMTDFVNLKIKTARSFKDTHIYRIYIRVFIEIDAHTCMSICDCTIFLKNNMFLKNNTNLFKATKN